MIHYCENQYCEFEAVKRVTVSTEKAGDSKRWLCTACEEAFTWGVQHGTMMAEKAVKPVRPRKRKKAPAEPVGEEYQTYGLDATGTLTHAGVNRACGMNAEEAKRIQREWSQWRLKYLDENPGDYPLRHCQPTVQLMMHPPGRPELTQTFNV